MLSLSLAGKVRRYYFYRAARFEALFGGEAAKAANRIAYYAKQRVFPVKRPAVHDMRKKKYSRPSTAKVSQKAKVGSGGTWFLEVSVSGYVGNGQAKAVKDAFSKFGIGLEERDYYLIDPETKRGNFFFLRSAQRKPLMVKDEGNGVWLQVKPTRRGPPKYGPSASVVKFKDVDKKVLGQLSSRHSIPISRAQEMPPEVRWFLTLGPAKKWGMAYLKKEVRKDLNRVFSF